MNLEWTGPRAGACVKLPVLRAACSVRGTHGAGSRDDALVRVCTETVQVQCAGDVTGNLAVRDTVERCTLVRMADPSKAIACYDAQGDNKAARIA